ncbi:hypothetical protein VHEMI04673 [[Torrubiella] hemipterigena]|uniref:Heterokaryon incompatibility domain-containing protein n=1 Tax=[Torrubiella] hemipterigena TaxID=1531966 RepID=A0A0A1TGV5_9HYPO|nr:hypothetical protein VHEMI04673 [[Torrubiella] hemipterigena]
MATVTALRNMFSSAPGIPVDSIPLGQHGALCEDCQQFDLHSFKRDIYGNRGYAFAKVKQSALQGCSFCSMIVDAFRDRRMPLAKSIFRRDASEDGWFVHFSLDAMEGKDAESGSLLQSVKVLRARLAPRNNLLPYSVMGSSRVEDWIEHSFHVVADPGSAAHDSGVVAGRWTDQVFTSRTTMTNLAARERGDADSFDQLPKPMLDVFDLARKLGIPYVWIDSICIIQEGDQGADWTNEAVKMGSYYQNAHLTISASSADASQGLIPSREDKSPRIARMVYLDQNQNANGYFYLMPFLERVDDEYREHVQESELFTRGWVFQEWLLSKRIIYFTPVGIIFECCTNGLRNERGEDVSTNYYDIWTSERPLTKPVYTFDNTQLENVWYWIVQWYSSLSLTMPDQDRVVALAGIADEYRLSLQRCFRANEKLPAPTVPCGGEYAAGLWIRDLHRGLTWQARPEADIARLPGFPTWSWASINTPVVWTTLTEYKTSAWALLWKKAEKAKKQGRMRDTAQVLGVVGSDGTSMTLHGDESNGGLDMDVAAPFASDSKFARLNIRAKFLRVLVREKMTTTEDLELTKFMLGPRDISNTTLWRKVVAPDNASEICGWASLEGPSLAEEKAFETGSGMEMSAFVLGLRRGDGGFGSGSVLRTTFTIYVVLFVQSTQLGYERLGIGHIFGTEMDAMYETAQEQDFFLV